MIHLERIQKAKYFKRISAGFADNTYRGLVDIFPKAKNAKTLHSVTLLMGNKCSSHSSLHKKEIRTKYCSRGYNIKISEDQLFYCQQRGLNPEEAVSLIVNGFCKEVLQQLPMEFAVEAQKLVGISLEGRLGNVRD